MYGQIPRQREIITRDDHDRIEPFTQKVKIVQMRYATANRPMNLSVHQDYVTTHFPGVRFDCLEFSVRSSVIEINRKLSTDNQDVYIPPTLTMQTKLENNVLTVWYVDRPGSLEQFLETVVRAFPHTPFNQLDLIPGYVNVTVQRKPAPIKASSS